MYIITFTIYQAQPGAYWSATMTGLRLIPKKVLMSCAVVMLSPQVIIYQLIRCPTHQIASHQVSTHQVFGQLIIFQLDLSNLTRAFNRKLPYEFRHYLWRGCSLSKIFNNVIYVFYMNKYLSGVTWKLSMGVEGIRSNFVEVGGRRRSYSDESVAHRNGWWRRRSFRKWSP